MFCLEVEKLVDEDIYCCRSVLRYTEEKKKQNFLEFSRGKFKTSHYKPQLENSQAYENGVKIGTITRAFPG